MSHHIKPKQRSNYILICLKEILSILTLVSFLFTATSKLYAQCPSGNAVYFDGNPIGRFIHPIVPSNSIGDNFTIEFWANPTGTIKTGMTASTTGFAGVNGQRYVVFPDWYNNTTQAGVGVSVGTNGVAVIEHANEHMPATLVHYTSISGWTHFAIVFENRIPSLYINSILITPSNGKVQSARAVYPSSNVGNFIVGGFGFHLYGPYMGYVDEFRIWGGALPQNTIAEWYNKELTGSHPNWGSIERYWNFNEPSGLHALDASGHGRYGTFMNDVARDIPAAAFHGYTYYADTDNDGYGDMNNPTFVCTATAPSNYVVNNTDCDDNDAALHPGQIWYIDKDGDNYGTGLNYTQCQRPLNGFLATELISVTGDCDDDNGSLQACPSNVDGLYALTWGAQGSISKYDVNADVITAVHQFTNDGSFPFFDNQMINGPDGKFYGTLRYGGKGFGILYSIDPVSGNYSKIKEFNKADGQEPGSRLLLKNDGKLYGMTAGGGLYNRGVIFSIDPITSFYTIVKNFDGTYGGDPSGGLTEGVDGKLYGMTRGGGLYSAGVIFSFDVNTSTYTKLKDFNTVDGNYPVGSLTLATDGKFYGLTHSGGSQNSGVIFSFNPLTNLYIKIADLTASTGSYPYGSLLEATNGKLYGMAISGGIFDNGTVFYFDPSTSAVIKIKDLNTSSGYGPFGSLTQGIDGKIYGMTKEGGSHGAGVIFSVDLSMNIYSKLHELSYSSAGVPYGSLIFDQNGKMYGTTASGGSYNSGIIFSFDQANNAFIKLKDFGSPNGLNPMGSLIQASDKKLYGTTTSGGVNSGGVIFSYSLATGTFSKLKDFPVSFNPSSKLLEGSDGKLYGVSSYSENQTGVLYSFDRLNMALNTLVEFNVNSSLGSQPFGALVQSTNGKLYGMTYTGGNENKGVIYSFDPTSSTYNKVKDFNGLDGSYPVGNLIEVNGKLYGMTSSGGSENAGVLFSFDPVNSIYNVLKNLEINEGGYGNGSLLLTTNGKLYGMTTAGGDNNYGVIFSFDISTNIYAKLKSFSGPDGSYPFGTLIQAKNGKLYGMTRSGGLFDLGVVFSFDPTTSVYTKLKDFNMINGGQPYYGAAFLEIKDFDCDPSSHTPTISASGSTTFCPGGSVVLTSSEADSYVWSNGQTTRSITVNAPGDYTVTIQYGNFCTATSAATTVTIEDHENPVVHTNNITVPLDNNGHASITPADINANSTDNCSIPETGYSLDKNNFTCSDIGANTVTLTVTDASGNSATGTAIVTVEDHIAPNVITQNITVDLDQNGLASITPSQVNNGSTDNCTIASTGYHLNKTSFTCDDLGMNTVTLTVTDVNGNAATASAIITVRDQLNPVVTAGSIASCYQTVSQAEAAALQVTHISDNCTGSETLTVLASTTGTCNATITITATDASNNSSSIVYNTKIDNTAPQLSLLPGAISVSCNQLVSLPLITAIDNCDGLVPVTFTETNTKGTDPLLSNYYNYVIIRKWSAVDGCGNQVTHNQDITVHDMVAPVITTIAGTLDRTVECSDASNLQQALSLTPVAQDNCASPVLHLLTDVVTAGCGSGFTRIRTWNFTDPSGNTSSTFMQTITVADATAPVITSNPGNVEHCFNGVAANYTVPALTATDNCNVINYSFLIKNSSGIVTRSGTTNNASGIFEEGTNTIYWTVKDICNNTTTAATTVLINPRITASFNSLLVLPQGVSTDMLYFGYAPASTASIVITVSGGTPFTSGSPYTLNWSASGAAASYFVDAVNRNIIHITAVQQGVITFSVKVTDSKGCEQTFTKTISVTDVRCGNNLNKVLVCQVPPGNPQNAHTNCLSPNAVATVLAGGGYLGSCVVSNNLVSKQGAEQEVTIPESFSVLAMPNPSNNYFSIIVKSDNEEKISVRVLNAVGQVIEVKQNIVPGATLNIGSGYAPGFYIAEVRQGRNIRTVKLVKGPSQ